MRNLLSLGQRQGRCSLPAIERNVEVGDAEALPMKDCGRGLRQRAGTRANITCQSILGQLAQNTLNMPVPFLGVEDATLSVFGARTRTRGQAVRLRRRHCSRAAAAKQGGMQQRAPPTTGSEHGNVA